MILILLASLIAPASRGPMEGPDFCSGLAHTRRIQRDQAVAALTKADPTHTECGLPTWEERFGSLEAGLRQLDQEHGLENAVLGVVLGSPYTLAFRMSEAEYAELRRTATPEGREAMDRWRRWRSEHACFDAKMLSLKPGQAVNDDSLPERCTVTVEAFMLKQDWVIQPTTLTWTKPTGRFHAPSTHPIIPRSPPKSPDPRP